jgi:hypothetical protein
VVASNMRRSRFRVVIDHFHARSAGRRPSHPHRLFEPLGRAMTTGAAEFLTSWCIAACPPRSIYVKGGDPGDRHSSCLDRCTPLLSAHHSASRTDLAKSSAGWVVCHDVLDHLRKRRGVGHLVSAHRRIRGRCAVAGERSGGIADPSPPASQPAPDRSSQR